MEERKEDAGRMELEGGGAFKRREGEMKGGEKKNGGGRERG